MTAPDDPGPAAPVDPRHRRYARVEREVRYRLPGVPELPPGGRVLRIEDRYLHGTGLRLRRVEEAGRETLLKLGQKVRLDPASPFAVAHTTMYLTQAEHEALSVLPGHGLRKSRHLVPLREGVQVAVDVFHGPLSGLVTVEIDLGERPRTPRGQEHDDVARLLSGGVDVTEDERHTGGALSAAAAPPPWPGDGSGPWR